MLTRFQSSFGYLYRLIDAAVVVAAWLMAYWVRFSVEIVPVTKGLPDFHTYSAVAPLVAVLWVAVFSWMKVYESRRMLGLFRSIQLVFRAHAVALLLFIALTYWFEEYRYSRVVMLSFACFSAFGLALSRALLLAGLRTLRSQGYNLRRVIAVGEGPSLRSAIERISGYPELGLRIVGVINRQGPPTGSSEEDTPSTATNARKSVAGHPVVGGFDDLLDILKTSSADEVLLALPSSQNADLDRLLTQLRDETVDVRMVPDINQYAALSCDIEVFDGLPIVHINDSPMVGLGAALKRGTDFGLAALGIVVLSPLLTLIAVMVKFSSPGPILYSQERMGLDGRNFNMLKFRSMKVDAEVASGPQWASKTDDRRTALGTFLRKTSLDELPQLWNVVRGDMSLVGPRPERPVFVHSFRTQIPNYMLRHKVKAGITGWAQINGWRGDTSLDRRIECDLFYIRNWSYLLDLKILTMTLWKGFIHKNAY